MSRTYKDTPYWVKVNREKGIVQEIHKHHELGRKLYRNATVFDENGEFVWEEYEYQTSDVFDYIEYEEDGFGNFKPIFLESWRTITRTGKRVKTEYKAVYEYADHCTIDEPHTNKTYFWLYQNDEGKLLPCHKQLLNQKEYRYESSEYLGSGYSGNRRNTKDKLKRITKYATTVGSANFEDADYEESIYETRLPQGWF